SFADIDEKEIRKMYVSLFQNFQIYSVSVLENVLLRPRKGVEDDEVVWDALKKSGLYDKVMATEKKLDTTMTKEFDDKGLVLSGGEQQKLAIARIFANSAPIIILDEPTSSLDPISEYEINKKILDLCTEKTVILISHRLSTVVDANKIYMMDKGRIVERGNHTQLMKKKGKYYEMFETQAHFYQETQEKEKSS
ncbi:MAG: ABC transporter ATP-binding protein, partial [Bacilli bacterium]|nr:ABC transporter ATP-binding protein [Bacilli bacterium]